MCERKYRHELKHYINHADYLAIRRRLREIAPLDRFSGPDGNYTVHSLYFDNLDNKALREKLDGVNNREKFRLRYYGDDPAWLKLEKKFKVNGLCGKRSARLSREEGERLLAGELDFLLEREEPLLAELYHKLRGSLLAPRTAVCYDREAFLYAPGNVRITLDRDVRTGLSPLDFLRPERFSLKPLSGLTVLEVKYDAFLPDLVRMAVQIPNRRAAACSKYALCRRYD